MARAIPRLLLSVLVGLVGISFGAIAAIRFHWGKPIATVRFENESERKLESVAIRYTTCGSTRELTHSRSLQSSLPVQEQQVTLKFVLCGEAGYVATVVFEDGGLLKSRGAYVESGYVVTERVRANEISTEHTSVFP